MRTELIIKTFLVFMAIMLFAGGAVAADLSGKWIAQTTSPSGSTGERIFTFKVSGNKLTGTIINQQTTLATFEPEGQPKMTGKLTTQSGRPQEISDGKINGDNISFATVARMGEMGIKTVYSGKISGDQINFTAETVFPEGFSFPGPPGGPRPQELVAKRME
jgi:hypothetical protein